MADASETLVTKQEIALEAAEKKEDLEKKNGGEEVIPQKVEEPAPDGSVESSGDKAVEEVEGESKPEDVPTDVLAAEMAVVAVPEANEPVVETVPDAKLEADVVVLETKTEEEAAVETILEVKQEDEPVKEVAANKLEEESIRIVSQARILEEEVAEAVPEEVIKEPEEPKEVAEAENEKQIEIPSVVEVVSEKAVIEEALEDKKEEGRETATTPDAAEEAIAKAVIEDKAVVEEAVKEDKPTESEAKDESETGSYAKAAVAEAKVTDPVKPEKKQSRNVISRMKRSLSKVKKAFAGKLPGSKMANSVVKAEEKAK